MGGDGWAYGLLGGDDWPCGSLYRVRADRKAQSLNRFDDYDGLNPQSLAIGSDGAFYGTTVTWGEVVDTNFKISRYEFLVADPG